MSTLSTPVDNFPYSVLMDGQPEHELFGNWLDRELIDRDWSIAEFARRANVPRQTAQKWVRNERVPDPPYCYRIADALNMAVDVVLEHAGHRIEDNVDLANIDPRLRLYMLGFPKLSPQFQRLMLKQLEALYEEAEAYRREEARDERPRT